MALSEAATTFLAEVRAHCHKQGTDEFDVSVEIFSAFYWMPWTVYVNGKEVTLSFNALETATLNELVAAGHIAVVKCWEVGKEPDDLEVSRTTYRML